jgi:hypothetical protein
MTTLQNFKQLFVFNKSARPWHMPLISALCVGVPVLIGAIFYRPQYGVLSGLGGMVFLYMPQTDITARMIRLGLCTLGFCLCFLIGAIGSYNIYTSSATLCLSSIIISLICRYYLFTAPGSFFFILIVAIAGTSAYNLSLIPLQVELVAVGGIFSCLIAFIYSLFTIDNSAISIPLERNRVLFQTAAMEALIIGFFVGSAFVFAQVMKFDNPYWVPISCAAIMQGSTFVAVWQRKIHRLLGTVIGLSLTWIIFSLSPTAIEVAFIIFALNFMVELFIVRNYALAVVFITPLTMLFAESTSIGNSSELLIMARLTDIIVGSTFGLAGGWLLRYTRLI